MFTISLKSRIWIKSTIATPHSRHSVTDNTEDFLLHYSLIETNERLVPIFRWYIKCVFTWIKFLPSSRLPLSGWEAFIGKKLLLPPPSTTWRHQISVEFYTLCLKNDPTLKRYSSKLYGSILMIFGRNIQKTPECSLHISVFRFIVTQCTTSGKQWASLRFVRLYSFILSFILSLCAHDF